MSKGHFLSVQQLCTSRQLHTRDQSCSLSYLGPLPTIPTALRVWMSSLVSPFVRQKSETQRGEVTCRASPASGPLPENKSRCLHRPAAAPPSDAGLRSGRLDYVFPRPPCPLRDGSPGDEGGRRPGLQPLHCPLSAALGPQSPSQPCRKLTSSCKLGILDAAVPAHVPCLLGRSLLH